MNHTSLIYIPKIKSKAIFRLICFPYAGGSSATYMSWQNLLHPDVELAVIQLPGRGIRLSEPPYSTMTELIKNIFLELEKLDRKPFIFYGHSMGARVAYELTLMLYRFHYQLPIHIFASGSVAPSIIRTKESIHRLPDNEFIAKIAALNGSPEAVIANREIMQLALPALRADFKIIETYCNKTQIIIPTKVSVFFGDKEDYDLNDIEAWFKLFKFNTGIHWIPGDHFFIETNKLNVLETINTLINHNIDANIH